jgi:phosphoglycolate phosphatase
MTPRSPDPILRDPIRAALIDLDGTLVDTLGDFDAALNATLAELALPALSRADIERRVGKGSEHLIRASLQAVGGDPGLYERAWAAYQRHYDAANGRHAQVYPGAIEGLTLLRARGVRMACVTNKPGRFARDLLQAKDLLGFFEHVFGGDAFAQRKPHPLPLIMAGQALQAEPAHTLMVGDSSNDAQAARAAGCPVVLVTYGYNHGEPVRRVDADAWLDSLAQLDGLLPAP